MTKCDVRCKGTKTDAELLDEYFGLEEPSALIYCRDYVFENKNYQREIEEYRRKKSSLEKAIGQDVITYETRLRGMEKNFNSRMGDMERTLQKMESRKRFLFF